MSIIKIIKINKNNYSKKNENSVCNLKKILIENLILIDCQQLRDFLLFKKMKHTFFYTDFVLSMKREIIFILKNCIWHIFYFFSISCAYTRIVSCFKLHIK